jgi:DNA-binding NtrC family response regulator
MVLKNIVLPKKLSPRILIVDDDEIFRTEFAEFFSEYGVAQASGGQEALNLLARPGEIDLVILDYKMPGMDGVAVLERIRAQNPKIAVVMLTAHSSKDLAVEALRGRADDYIEKPPEKEEIDRIIEKFVKPRVKEGTNLIEEKIAREQGHHPVLTLNYNKLKITLTTHASGGLTENDFIMARAIDEAE